MFNKKAVSTVVATVLIIMITVAAVGIIYAAIIPMVRNSIDKGNACFSAQSDISLIINAGHTCVNATSKNVSLNIGKGPDTKVDLAGIQVLLFVGGDSTSKTIKATNNGSDGIWGNLPNDNEEKVITINSSTTTERVAIAPIVLVGKTQETCDKVQEVTLSPCS